MAIQSAIKQGKVLDKKEMTMLIDQLFACEQPNFAPNGDKTFITLTLEELSKGFFK
jgi:DNA mismatch repair protein MutL